MLLASSSPLVIGVFLFGGRVLGQNPGQCTTNPLWHVLNNKIAQTPCDQLYELGDDCNGGVEDFKDWAPLAAGSVYRPPNPCYCSIEGYNLASACAACQNVDNSSPIQIGWMGSPEWTKLCNLTTLTHSTNLPSDFPLQGWVLMLDPVSFMLNETLELASVEATQQSSIGSATNTNTASASQTAGSGSGSSITPPPSSPSSSSTPGTSSNIISKHTSTPIGAIVGGIVGGILVVAIVGALIYYLTRPNRQRARSNTFDLDDEGAMKGTSNMQPSFPSDAVNVAPYFANTPAWPSQVSPSSPPPPSTTLYSSEAEEGTSTQPLMSSYIDPILAPLPLTKGQPPPAAPTGDTVTLPRDQVEQLVARVGELERRGGIGEGGAPPPAYNDDD